MYFTEKFAQITKKDLFLFSCLPAMGIMVFFIQLDLSNSNDSFMEWFEKSIGVPNEKHAVGVIGQAYEDLGLYSSTVMYSISIILILAYIFLLTVYFMQKKEATR